MHKLLAVCDSKRAILRLSGSVAAEANARDNEGAQLADGLSLASSRLTFMRVDMEPSNYREPPPPKVWALSNGQLIRDADDASALAQAIVDTIRDPLLVLDQNLRVVTANRAFLQTFKMNHKDIQGHPVYGLGDGQWDIPELRLLLEDVGPQHARRIDLSGSRPFAGGNGAGDGGLNVHGGFLASDEARRTSVEKRAWPQGEARFSPFAGMTRIRFSGSPRKSSGFSVPCQDSPEKPAIYARGGSRQGRAGPPARRCRSRVDTAAARAGQSYIDTF